MSEKIFIAHIHSYKNFIDRSTNCFEHDGFLNGIYYLSGENDYDGDYSNQVIRFDRTKSNIKKLIDECEKYHIVIVYGLDRLMSYLINRLPESTIVIWRFFGMELYSRLNNEMYSDQEKDYFKVNIKELNFINSLKVFHKRLKHFIIWKTSMEKEILRSFENIDYFLGLSSLEHEKLCLRFKLPKFIQYPLSIYNVPDISKKKGSKKILIGNNRSPYNNYLEIIEILKDCQNFDIEFYVQFSYGYETIYSKEVQNRMHDLKNVKLIERYVTYEQYEEIFQSMGTFVLNGYRQMGIGAVFNSLVNGLKVYLNKKNIIYDWLKQEGFLVYEIMNLKNDIRKGSYNLSHEERKYNLEIYSKISNKYSLNKFQNMILNLPF